MKKVFLSLALLAIVSVSVVSCKDKAAEAPVEEVAPEAAPMEEVAPAADSTATEMPAAETPAAETPATEEVKK